ncbi:MAG: hypothetical protein ACLQVD_13375 [Capsulimonadaceae bacterium]
MTPNHSFCFSRVVRVRVLLILASFVVFVSGVAPAAADVLVDTFTDFSKITSRTNNWKFSTDHPERVGNYQSRLSRTDANAASIVYHLQGISNFDVVVAVWGQQMMQKVELSADGKNWYTPLQGETRISDQQYGFEVVDVPQLAPLEPGMNYLRLTIGPGVPGSDANGPFVWSPQVCKVSIAYSGAVLAVTTPSASATAPANTGTPTAAPTPTVPELTIPGGLTALAASGSASIQWLPIPNASNYVLKRSDDGGASFKDVASNISLNYYVDKGLSSETGYSYRVVGQKSDGSPVATETVSVKPIHGAVLMTDPFDDWGQADSHSDNVQLTRFDGLVNCVKRTTTDFGSVVYNLPGTVRFAFTTYIAGDIVGQVSADSSPDGQTWSPVKLAYTEPVPFGDAGHYAAVWAPDADLPGGTNYIRINLLGDPNAKGAPDTPALGLVRIAYGATDSAPPPVPATAPTMDTFEDTLADWSKTTNHSDCLALDGACDKVKCIQRHGPTEGSVVYHVPHADKFAFDMYYDSGKDEIRVESSLDDKTWAPVDLSAADPVPATGDRQLHSVETPRQPLPDGTAYLRITFPGTWGVEVGDVKIFSGSTSDETPAVTPGTVGDGGLPTGTAAVKPTGGSPPGATGN